MPAQPDQLEAREVRVHFEGVKALDGVDLALPGGMILGLIGPNGAGKTTLINVLSGFQRPTAGSVLVSGNDATGWPPHRIARGGVTRTFQNIRLFNDLTVLENIELGAIGAGSSSRDARQLAWALLERINLADRAATTASSLPYGEERLLGIARALAARPRFLLLDEPAAGLNEAESAELVTVLARIRDDFECSLLVIEHDMGLIMRLCDRVQVLDYGKTIAVGSPDEVKSNPAVLAAYLGTE